MHLSALAAIGILLAHLVGDYILQTHHQATEKTKHLLPAILHGITYTLPFLFITHNVWTLLIIAGTHVVIDRWRLAKHLIWFKNQFAPKAYRPPHTPTGYPAETPDWMAVWLMIICDNTVHILIAVGAVAWLG